MTIRRRDPAVWRQRLLWMAAGAALLVLLGGIVGAVVLYSGVYNVSARSEHTPPVYWALEKGMRASVRRHAAGIETPDLTDPELLNVGARCFHVNCVQCHGGPGIGPEDIGKSVMPIPNSLTQPARDWPPRELYWVTRNGIKMAGMPAWEHRLADRDIWAIVAFLHQQLPNITVGEYARLVRDVSQEDCSRPTKRAPPDPDRGLVALRQYGCHGCHKIPGVTGPDIYVGPPLERIASRSSIAGVLPNTRENMIRWLREPQAIAPRTMMPDLGVTEQHAADMVAYLQTLE